MKYAPPKPNTLEAAAGLLKAFADPVRLRLLNLLAPDREVCVCHLHEALALPQPTVSRHLAYLRKNGLVVGRKEGLWVYYRRAKPRSVLHRTLIDSIPACLRDTDLCQQDQQRLPRVDTCCGEP
jgi:ArsR family transcriptional regulator, arsenate/arsenite/antimonite-responsive transcriptional repressor